MSRNFAIALGVVAVLALAANLQAQGPGGAGGGRGMGPGMGQGGILFLVQNEQVQKDIELVAEQKEKITALGKETREAMTAKMGDMANLSQEERRTKRQEVMKEMQKETQKKVEGVLLPHQLERIKQIEIQLLGAAALSNPEVVKALVITEEQQSKIKAAHEESQKAMDEMWKSMSSLSREERQAKRQEMQEKVTKARTDTEKKVMEVLTAEQKEKFEKLKGPKFDVSALRGGPGAGGNRRGAGGTVN